MFLVSYLVFEGLVHVAQGFVGDMELYKVDLLPFNGERASHLFGILARAFFNKYCGHTQTPYRKPFGYCGNQKLYRGVRLTWPNRRRCLHQIQM